MMLRALLAVIGITLVALGGLHPSASMLALGAVIALYGLLPRRGVRVRRRGLRAALRAVGVALLLLSAVSIANRALGRPRITESYIAALLLLLLIPGVTLTLYGFELGVVPRVSEEVGLRVGALALSASLTCVGLGLLAGASYMLSLNPQLVGIIELSTLGAEIPYPVCYAMLVVVAVLALHYAVKAAMLARKPPVAYVEHHGERLSLGKLITRSCLAALALLLLLACVSISATAEHPESTLTLIVLGGLTVALVVVVASPALAALVLFDGLPRGEATAG